MRSPVRLALLVLAALVVHQTLFATIRVGDVHPQLMLLVAVAAGIAGGSERGAVTGFVCGLLGDVFVRTPLGLSALTFTLVAFVVGTVQSSVIRSSWWIPPLTAFVASAAAVLLYGVLGALVGRSEFVRPQLLVVAAIVAAVNAVLAPPVVRAMSWAMAGPEPSYAR
jgi:rod shape-determining protein MreD